MTTKELFKLFLKDIRRYIPNLSGSMIRPNDTVVYYKVNDMLLFTYELKGNSHIVNVSNKNYVFPESAIEIKRIILELVKHSKNSLFSTLKGIENDFSIVLLKEAIPDIYKNKIIVGSSKDSISISYYEGYPFVQIDKDGLLIFGSAKPIKFEYKIYEIYNFLESNIYQLDKYFQAVERLEWVKTSNINNAFKKAFNYLNIDNYVMLLMYPSTILYTIGDVVTYKVNFDENVKKTQLSININNKDNEHNIECINEKHLFYNIVNQYETYFLNKKECSLEPVNDSISDLITMLKESGYDFLDYNSLYEKALSIKDEQDSANIIPDETCFGNVQNKNGSILQKNFKERENYNSQEYFNSILKEEKDNLILNRKKINQLISYHNSYIKKISIADDVWDEDSRIDYVMQNGTNIRNKEILSNLEKSLPKPYFRRMIYDSKEGPKDFYIGKYNIYDKNMNLLIHAWDSPIGTISYDTKRNLYLAGNLLTLNAKREIYIENETVESVSETYNKEIGDIFYDTRSDQYLLKVLENHKYSKQITNIIETIQYEQTQIITSPTDRDFVMQGCAGCGKTMILFHRIRYIIDNFPDLRSGICVITPSKAFNDFINPLLQDLEIYSEPVLSVEDFYIDSLDKFLYHSKNIEGFISNFFNGNFKSRFNIEKVKIMPDDTLPNEIVSYFYSDEFFDKVMNVKQFALHNLTIYTLRKLNDDEINNFNLFDFLLDKSSIKKIIPAYIKTKSTIHRCELFALCLIFYRKCGMNRYSVSEKKVLKDVKYKNFDLTMIDEIQDFNFNEVKLIKNLGNQTTLNLFGDVNQCIKKQGLHDFNMLTKITKRLDFYNYNKNYRNTNKMVDYLNTNLGMKMEPLGIIGDNVATIGFNELSDNVLIDHNERVAIIGLEKYRSKFHSFRKLFYSVGEIKGLEFDSVYVYPNEMDNNQKYVAMTRGLNNLTIIQD